MNGIFKIKRKLHWLINSIFYLIFFIAGYFVGGGNIENIQKIISNFYN